MHQNHGEKINPTGKLYSIHQVLLHGRERGRNGRLERIGLGWIGLDRIGLDWIGLVDDETGQLKLEWGGSWGFFG